MACPDVVVLFRLSGFRISYATRPGQCHGHFAHPARRAAGRARSLARGLDILEHAGRMPEGIDPYYDEVLQQVLVNLATA